MVDFVHSLVLVGATNLFKSIINFITPLFLMKKTYQIPKATGIELRTERMIASSFDVGVNPDEDVDAGDTFSNQKSGWDSEDWETEE